MAAPGGVFTCRVLEVGPAEDGHIYIRLYSEESKFPDRWFSATDAIKQDMLTTALTAISYGFPVSAALSSTDEYSRIARFYVKRS